MVLGKKGQKLPHVISDNVYAIIRHQVKVQAFLYLFLGPNELHLRYLGVHPAPSAPSKPSPPLSETDWYPANYPWHCVLELDPAARRTSSSKMASLLPHIIPIRRDAYFAPPDGPHRIRARLFDRVCQRMAPKAYGKPHGHGEGIPHQPPSTSPVPTSCTSKPKAPSTLLSKMQPSIRPSLAGPARRAAFHPSLREPTMQNMNIEHRFEDAGTQYHMDIFLISDRPLIFRYQFQETNRRPGKTSPTTTANTTTPPASAPRTNASSPPQNRSSPSWPTNSSNTSRKKPPAKKRKIALQNCFVFFVFFSVAHLSLR